MSHESQFIPVEGQGGVISLWLDDEAQPPDRRRGVIFGRPKA